MRPRKDGRFCKTARDQSGRRIFGYGRTPEEAEDDVPRFSLAEPAASALDGALQVQTRADERLLTTGADFAKKSFKPLDICANRAYNVGMEQTAKVLAKTLRVGDKVGARIGSREVWGRVYSVGADWVRAENARETFAVRPDDEVLARRLDRDVPTDLEALLATDKSWTGYELQLIEGAEWSPTNPGQERWFFRYGRPPEGGRSRNHLNGALEDGVSVYVTPRPTSIIDTSRPLYALRGRPIGLGSDDEPVIVVTGEVRLIAVASE